MPRSISVYVLFLIFSISNLAYAGNPIAGIERIIKLLTRSETADAVLIEGMSNYRNANRLPELWGKLLGDVDDAQSLLKGIYDPHTHVLLGWETSFARASALDDATNPQIGRSRLRLFHQLLEENEAIRAFEGLGSTTELIQGPARLLDFSRLGIDAKPITDILINTNRTHLDILLNMLKLEGGLLRSPEVADDLVDFVTGVGRAETALRITTDTLRASVNKLSGGIRLIDVRNTPLGGMNHLPFNTTMAEWFPKMMERWLDLEATSDLLQEPIKLLRTLARSKNTDEALLALERWRARDPDLLKFFPDAAGNSHMGTIPDLQAIAENAITAQRHGEAFEAVVLSRSLVSVSKLEKALKLLRVDMSSVPGMQNAIQEIEGVCNAQQRLLRRKMARLRLPYAETRWRRTAPPISQTLVSRTDLADMDAIAETVMSYIKQNRPTGSLPTSRELEITTDVLRKSVERATTLISDITTAGKPLGPQAERKIAEILGERKALFETIADLL